MIADLQRTAFFVASKFTAGRLMFLLDVLSQGIVCFKYSIAFLLGADNVALTKYTMKLLGFKDFLVNWIITN